MYSLAEFFVAVEETPLRAVHILIRIIILMKTTMAREKPEWKNASAMPIQVPPARGTRSSGQSLL